MDVGKTRQMFILVSSLFIFLLSFEINLAAAEDTIRSGESLSGKKTIISQGGIFELGLYTPSTSHKFYLAIWYKSIGKKTVLWVANPSKPLLDATSELRLLGNGNLALFDQSPEHPVWSTNSTSKIPNTAVAVLLDTGNLVSRDDVSSPHVLLWQSFDHRTDVAAFQVIKDTRSKKSLISSKHKRQLLIIGGINGGLILLLLGSFVCYTWKEKKFTIKGKRAYRNQDLSLFDPSRTTSKKLGFGLKKGNSLPLFSFARVAAATNDFAASNKLGEGGFGLVYMGELPDGQEVAVKRLSKSSIQGLEEFKNEITLISELQHVNLVKLVGCCIEGEEKILIYEYMINKSLDFFLFDQTNRVPLNWIRSMHIIEGIAQGLLYLHKYSRLRIIHRDLKASNILLDDDMNPKISDFGMARIYAGNESKANTNRVVGTFGYMPPEYAVEGAFSVKSDVFSFGVLLLEIITGKRATSFCQPNHYSNLLTYAWELWKNGRSLEMMDPILSDRPPQDLLIRYINVALLCVQERASDRPIMSDVIYMLSNENLALPKPKEPAFFVRKNEVRMDGSPIRPRSCSLNNVTISEVETR